MDAAWEMRGSKTVLGLMVVEAPDDVEGSAPGSYWLSQADAQVEQGMLEDSLPHRTSKERAEIADGFLGVATWQRVCLEFHLPWPPIADIG